MCPNPYSFNRMSPCTVSLPDAVMLDGRAIDRGSSTRSRDLLQWAVLDYILFSYLLFSLSFS